MRIDLGGGGASVGHILAGLDSEVLGGDASVNIGAPRGLGFLVCLAVHLLDCIQKTRNKWLYYS